MADLPVLFGSLTVSIISATGLKDSDGWGAGSSDPYVTVYLDGSKIARTKVKNEDQNPVFEEGTLFLILFYDID